MQQLGTREQRCQFRAVFKWLSKNQNQSNNYCDQSQQEQTARWTNHNSWQSPVTRSKRGKNHAYMVRMVLVLLLIDWKPGTSLKPITKRSNRNHVITFDSHLKIALSIYIRTLLLNWRSSSSNNRRCSLRWYWLNCLYLTTTARAKWNTILDGHCGFHLSREIILVVLSVANSVGNVFLQQNLIDWPLFDGSYIDYLHCTLTSVFPLQITPWVHDETEA